ncbi:MAG: hypothetical protein ACTSQY_05115 [Candidatus Odinarchaeia archaeon]
MSIRNEKLNQLLLNIKKYKKNKKYYEVAQTYEKIAKKLHKINTKKSVEYFNLAIEYYLKCANIYNRLQEYDTSAKCYENLGRLYKKWLNEPDIALEYFMTATNHRMRNVKNNLEYNSV